MEKLTFNNEQLEFLKFIVQDFAFYYVNEVDKTTKDIPNWLTIDYADIWENKLSEDYFEIDCDMSEYTYGHIFKRKVN